jgi:hypothetical protein
MENFTTAFILALVGCISGISIGIWFGKFLTWIFEKILDRKAALGVFEHFQPNIRKSNASDCSIRAVAKIFEISWDAALDLIVKYSHKYGENTNNSLNLNTVFFEELGMHVYQPAKKITFGEFAAKHPDGVYALNSHGHICACVNGVLYDSWDSRKNRLWFYSTNVKENNPDNDITFGGGIQSGINTKNGYND